MELQTIEEILKEPIELLKKEVEEYNAFYQAVSRMRELQKNGWKYMALISDEKAAEKQVDDFLAKRSEVQC